MSRFVERVSSINLTDSPRFLEGTRPDWPPGFARGKAERLSAFHLPPCCGKEAAAYRQPPQPFALARLHSFLCYLSTILSFIHESSDPFRTHAFSCRGSSVSFPQTPASREGSGRAQHDDPLTTGTRDTNGKHIETTRALETADARVHVGKERRFGVRHHCPSANAYGEASQRPGRYTLAR